MINPARRSQFVREMQQRPVPQNSLDISAALLSQCSVNHYFFMVPKWMVDLHKSLDEESCDEYDDNNESEEVQEPMRLTIAVHTWM